MILPAAIPLLTLLSIAFVLLGHDGELKCFAGLHCGPGGNTFHTHILRGVSSRSEPAFELFGMSCVSECRLLISQL